MRLLAAILLAAVLVGCSSTRSQAPTRTITIPVAPVEYS